VLERWCEAEVREAVKAARASGVWGEGVVVGLGGEVVGGWVGIVCWWGKVRWVQVGVVILKANPGFALRFCGCHAPPLSFLSCM